MATSDNNPGISIMEGSGGVQPAQASLIPANVPSVSKGGDQTTVVTSSSSTDTTHPSVNPSLATATNTNSVGVSNSNVHQSPGAAGNGSLMQQEQPGPDTLEKVSEAARSTGTYSGALIMTAAVVPLVAAVISAIAYIVHWPQAVTLPDWLAAIIGTPLLVGTIPTLIVWLLLAIIIRRFTAVDRMNMMSYGQLLNRLSTMDSQLDVLDPEQSTLPTSASMARKEVSDSTNTIIKKLGNRSLGWVTASGYIDLWQEMHNAEEALLNMLPREEVISQALYDEMRIKDSNIDTSDALLDKLRRAVTVLDPKAEGYLQSPPSKLQEGVKGPDDVPASTGPTPTAEEMQPRSVLREVRHALNEFRDSRWEAIVRVRNQFVCTMILTGLTLYVLLEFSILSGAPQPAMIAATAFYLVGALVGLFNRLYSESQTSKSIDDYRLALVRLVATPLYCGLAAVGGVLVVQQFTSLLDILNPKNLLSGLIVAAVFGLTPGLLITRLQNKIEAYKSDLKSTAASQGQIAKTH
ncbi:MAG TPA: hypothetical protein VED37_01035 [Ktedonobacteraceae bacterium]|nr:hypothetical protein [Ktedonobacteraceae bacterium]